MSSILIDEGEYNGFRYKIKFAAKGDWGDMREKFFSESCFSLVVDDSFAGVKSKLFNEIDAWIKTEPASVKDWVDLAYSCVIDEGNNDGFSIDEKKLFIMLEKYKRLKT